MAQFTKTPGRIRGGKANRAKRLSFESLEARRC